MAETDNPFTETNPASVINGLLGLQPGMMDLGLLVLLLCRNGWDYLLTSVHVLKAITLGLAV